MAKWRGVFGLAASSLVILGFRAHDFGFKGFRASDSGCRLQLEVHGLIPPSTRPDKWGILDVFI